MWDGRENLSTITGMNDSLKNWIPVTADVLGLILHIVLFSTLYNLFSNRNAAAWFVVAGTYFVFCLAVNGLKKLQPDRNEETPSWLDKFDFTRSRPITVLIGVMMAFTVIMIQADINQLVESAIILAQNPGEVHEGEVSLYYAFGPSFLWTILGLFYLLVLITNVEQNVEPNSGRYMRNEFVGLLATNALIVVYSAYFATLVDRVQLGGIELIIGLIGLLLLYTVLFDPLRLLHFLKRPQPLGLISYIIFVAYCLIRVFV